jgi:hypothetical protein
MQIKLSENNLLDYFNFEESWQVCDVNPLPATDFVSRNSDTLLVTVGDSWTWGAGLDSKQRRTQVWGNVVSEIIGADWLNLAQPGQSNQWMANRCRELYNISAELEYKKIVVVVVFTGAARSLDLDFDYIHWFENNSIHDFLPMLNTKAVRTITNKPSNVELYLSSNMVDPLGYTSSFKSWYNVLGLIDPNNVYTDMTGIDCLTKLEEFIKDEKLVEYKQWMLEQIDLVECRDKFYDDDLFYDFHPVATAQLTWAQYVGKQL